MHLVNKKGLEKFWSRYTDTKKYLENWCRKVEINRLCTPDELREEFPTVRLLGGGQAVFKVKKNRYRLIAKFYFQDGVAQICWIGTHPEYDRVDATTVCGDTVA